MRDDEHDDDTASQSDRPMSFFAAAAWTFGASILSVVIVQITDGARPGAESDLVNLTACRVLAYSLLIFGMLRFYAPDASVRDVLGVRPTSPVAMMLTIVGGLALYPALDVIDAFVMKRFPYSADDVERLEKLTHPTTVAEHAVLFVSFVIVFPVFEELFFRGALFRGLHRARPEGLAVLASAAFYAMSEGDPRGLPTAFVLGLFAAWIRGRSGSVLPAIAANAAYNALPIVPLALGRGEPKLAPAFAVGGAVAAALCAWGAGMIYTRDARAERGRLLDA